VVPVTTTVERPEPQKTADAVARSKKVVEPWVVVDPKREKKTKPKSTTTKVSIKLADIESAAKRMIAPQKQATTKKEVEVPIAEKHPRRMIDLFDFGTLAALERKKVATETNEGESGSTQNVRESKMISQHIDNAAWPEVSMATLVPQSEKIKKLKAVVTKKLSSGAKAKEETKKAPEKRLRRAMAKGENQVNPNICDVNATFVKKGKERSKKVRLTKLKKLIVSERNARWVMDAILKPIIDKIVSAAEAQQATPVVAHKPKRKHKQILASLDDFSRMYHTLPEGVLARKYCRQMSRASIDAMTTQLLGELARFQERLKEKDPNKANLRKRYVCGLREVSKGIRGERIKSVIVSRNIEHNSAEGGLDSMIWKILDLCNETKVFVIFALSRKKLGAALGKHSKISAVGLLDYSGADDLFKSIRSETMEAQEEYQMFMHDTALNPNGYQALEDRLENKVVEVDPEEEAERAKREADEKEANERKERAAKIRREAREKASGRPTTTRTTPSEVTVQPKLVQKLSDARGTVVDPANNLVSSSASPSLSSLATAPKFAFSVRAHEFVPTAGSFSSASSLAKLPAAASSSSLSITAAPFEVKSPKQRALRFTATEFQPEAERVAGVRTINFLDTQTTEVASFVQQTNPMLFDELTSLRNSKQSPESGLGEDEQTNSTLSSSTNLGLQTTDTNVQVDSMRTSTNSPTLERGSQTTQDSSQEGVLTLEGGEGDEGEEDEGEEEGDEEDEGEEGDTSDVDMTTAALE